MQWHYGCIFCRTGSEESLASHINGVSDATEAIAPKRLRRKTVGQVVTEDYVQMLPSYVFFRTVEPTSISHLQRISAVLRILEYDRSNWELVGQDRAFAEFLFGNNLPLCPEIQFIDGRLHFTQDPFLGHDDAVLRVNRKKRTAEVHLNISELTFWISYVEV